MIYKYWPKISKEEFINYETEELKKEIKKKETESDILKIYTDATKLINRKKKKEIECDAFEIKYIKLLKNQKNLKI